MSLTEAGSPALVVRHDESVPVLVVPATASFDELRDAIRSTMPTHLAAMSTRTIRIDLGEREIKLFDLRRLVHILRDEFQVEVTGLYVRAAEIHRYAERELKLRLFTVAPQGPMASTPPPADASTEDATPTVEDAVVATPSDAQSEQEPEPEAVAESRPSDPGRRTLHVHRTLRSGASIRFEGDVLMFGDVNPGAQVVAAGNVIVLGAIKGLVHAGATGDEDCFILGFDLKPTQIRIGRKIAVPPAREGARTAHHEIARVADGQIVIEPYTGP